MTLTQSTSTQERTPKMSTDTIKRRVVKTAQERREEIMLAAFDLFRQKGFAETAVGDIATKAGVATGTVYLYFQSKDHLLLAIHEKFHSAMHENIATLVSDYLDRSGRGEPVDYRELIETVIDEMAEYNRRFRDYGELCVKYIPGANLTEELYEVNRRSVQFLAGMFHQAKEAGLLHASDPEMMAYLIHGSMMESIKGWCAYNDPPDLDRLMASAKELLKKALGPDVKTVKQTP